MRTKNKDKELNHRHFVAVRLTDVELNLLDQGATCFSISRSEYLRKLLLEKQINHQIKVVADMNDLRKLVSEYGKIGSNLNQIAKHFNSAVERQPYMDKPHEEAAGYKHRSTDKFMSTFKKTVMDRCQQEGLHQIDLLAPAERKITQKEYQAQKHGQQKLNEINQKIIEDGLKPTSTVFLTIERIFAKCD